MIIMALDHSRDFMHVDSLTQNPLDLATTTPILFFTRWITHFCTPIFVFLSGTSAYLSIKNRNDVVKSRNFLISRGGLVNFFRIYHYQFCYLVRLAFQNIAFPGNRGHRIWFYCSFFFAEAACQDFITFYLILLNIVCNLMCIIYLFTHENQVQR